VEAATLWSALTCRGHDSPELIKRCGAEPPKAKAATGRRIPRS
jgi:hypothetical protein